MSARPAPLMMHAVGRPIEAAGQTPVTDVASACPDCGSGLGGGRCIICVMRRMHEQHRQMRERSGPPYDLAAGRNRTASDAYQAAGRPPKVILVIVGSTGANGEQISEQRWYLAARYKRGEMVEATPRQVAAWAAWRAGRP